MQFIPHEYQKYTIDFIKTHPAAAAFLDCGLGKTVICLSALKDLLEEGEISKVLVVAPLRVARDVWPVEAGKWRHLNGLKISVVLGTPKQRRAALEADAQIYVTNRDNVQWLVAQKWPIYLFDAVVLDELSSFKNYSAQRTRAVYRLCREAKRVIGLTGTPASNGLMDLWSEIGVLDGGQRLGKSLKWYQQYYFTPVSYYQNHPKDWKLKPGAEKAIYAAIGDMTISMKAMDHLQMPELISSDYPVYMDERERRQYETLTQEMTLRLKGGEVTAKNAMSLGTKLIQMSNGLVYGTDGTPIMIHSRKIEALEDLIEAANGKPVLVVYNYRHDLLRISAMLRDKGYTHAQLDSKESIRAWNRGELQVGLINPQSAGHGLNLQEGGSRMIWYSLPWSLEHYQQTCARLWRQGQKENTVVIQHIITEGTIDKRIMAVLQRKNKTQNALIDAVKAELKS
ncbi:MAG: DEAD/DEAH box helicase [Oscillospiraceae bacterium]|nr:DEAD/DEAH box helicase [Oscillospiraceae bacterium]